MQYLKAILYSFYKRSWYRQMAQPQTRYVLRYLLVLSAILSIMITVRFTINLSVNAGVVIHQIVAQTPEMKLTNGKLSTKTPGTYHIIAPGRVLLGVINTDSQYQGFAKKEVAVWFGPDAMHARFLEKPELISYNKVNMKLDHKAITKVVRHYADVFIVICIIASLIVCLFLSYALLMLVAWAMTPLIRNLSKSLDYTLDYKAARNLALASLSPFFSLLALFYMFDVLNMITALILIVSLCVYPAIAVQAGKHQRK